MTSLPYRIEIDGLRGIAVLAVILFHADISFLKGGYLGVDIFFVISGYLITGIIFKELNSNNFSIAEFYERRARRVLPAFLFMLICTCPIAFFLYFPSDLISYAKSVLAALTLTSNFLFEGRRGYFDTDSHLEPLVHTWSLSVEEQFYLLYPWIFLIFWKFFFRYIYLIVSVFALISLTVALVMSTEFPNFVFFQLLPRVWELLAGALVALFMFKELMHNFSLTVRNIGGAVGLTLILVSLVIYGEANSIFAINQLMPVIGTCLVILFVNKETVVGRLLSFPALTVVGLISYSAYLWHQPLFAFARYAHIYSNSLYLKLGLILISLLFGFISYNFIEKKFRDKLFLSAHKLLIGFLLITLAMMLTSMVIIYNRGFPNRVPAALEYRSLGEKLSKLGDVCATKPVNEYLGVESCVFGSPDGRLLIGLYGDSHAQAVQFELDRQLKERGLSGIWLKAAGCHIVPDIIENADVSMLSQCRSSFKELMRYVQDNVDSMIVTSRWTFRLFPVANQIENLSFDNNEGGVEYNPYRVYRAADENNQLSTSAKSKQRAVEFFLNALDSTKKQTVLVYPIPELGWDIAKVNFFSGKMVDEISTSRALYEARNSFVINIFNQFESKNLIKFRVADIFCNELRCFGQSGGLPLYYDDDHISDHGARPLVKAILDDIAPIMDVTP